MRRFLTLNVCITVLGLVGSLGALVTTPAMAFVYDRSATGWAPVSEAVLDGLRGGFQSSLTGPIVSFGIERTVFLNGHLVSSVTLTIPDASKIAANVRDAITLVQHGSGNKVSHDVSALAPFTTVIQNSLDHQTIQSHTVINATVATLGWARSLDLGYALSTANLNALRH